MNDQKFMELALREAEKAGSEGEVPVGAVLVCGDTVLVAAHNRKEDEKDISAHAEILVLREAGKKRGDWRFPDCTLYVTLEPCPMCAGAILAARIGRVVYGARDAAAGALGSVLNLPRYPLGSSPEVIPDVMCEECRALLRNFFGKKR